MGTRTRTTLDSARAKELAANRPAASQRRTVDYSAIARSRWDRDRAERNAASCYHCKDTGWRRGRIRQLFHQCSCNPNGLQPEEFNAKGCQNGTSRGCLSCGHAAHDRGVCPGMLKDTVCYCPVQKVENEPRPVCASHGPNPGDILTMAASLQMDREKPRHVAPGSPIFPGAKGRGGA